MPMCVQASQINTTKTRARHCMYIITLDMNIISCSRTPIFWPFHYFAMAGTAFHTTAALPLDKSSSTTKMCLDELFWRQWWMCPSQEVLAAIGSHHRDCYNRIGHWMDDSITWCQDKWVYVPWVSRKAFSSGTMIFFLLFLFGFLDGSKDPRSFVVWALYKTFELAIFLA